MKKLQLKPIFVKTQNVRNFEVMMNGLALAEGEGRLGLIYGQAGRGKTRTSQWYAANNRCVYLRIANIWRTSEFNFLQALCRELGMKFPPGRRGKCFDEIVDRLLIDNRPVFLDEPEKLPGHFLDTIRDLWDISTAPFILIGEEEIIPYMQKNSRVWSRCYQKLEFDPINPGDIILYTKESFGINLARPVADIIHKSSRGDFRLVRRDMLALVQIANANQTVDITEEMARVAINEGLTGNNNHNCKK